MKRVELVASLARNMPQYTKTQIDEILDMYQTFAFNVLFNYPDEKVPLPGLGYFAMKQIPERYERYASGSRKGEEFIIPAHSEPYFKLSGHFKNLMVEGVAKNENESEEV